MRRLNGHKFGREVLHPYDNKAMAVTVVESRKLFLGVDRDSETGRCWVTLFVKAPRGCSESGDEICEVDTLHYSPCEKERDKRVRPFFWSNFQKSKGQTRADVKSRLKSLGFNPSVVDLAYPPRLAAHRK